MPPPLTATFRLFGAAIGICVCLNAQSQRVVCDGNSCKIEPAGNEIGYTVVSPVGHASIMPIKQAPRLDTLAGKTIAVVGYNFMARVTHPEIKRLILEKYPTAKVILRRHVAMRKMGKKRVRGWRMDCRRIPSSSPLEADSDVRVCREASFSLS